MFAITLPGPLNDIGGGLVRLATGGLSDLAQNVVNTVTGQQSLEKGLSQLPQNLLGAPVGAVSGAAQAGAGILGALGVSPAAAFAQQLGATHDYLKENPGATLGLMASAIGAGAALGGIKPPGFTDAISGVGAKLSADKAAPSAVAARNETRVTPTVRMLAKLGDPTRGTDAPAVSKFPIVPVAVGAAVLVGGFLLWRVAA